MLPGEVVVLGRESLFPSSLILMTNVIVLEVLRK